MTTTVSTSFTDNGDGTATLTSTTTDILPADVTVNPDGSITLNVRLTFLNPFDINTTGVGTITVLPDSSLAAFLPLLGRGVTGMSPIFDTAVLHEVINTDPLPTPNITITLADPGDPTTTPPQPPVWHIEMWVHAGPEGVAGTPVNVEALGNVVVPGGGLLNGTQLNYRSVDGKWHVEAVRFVDSGVCTAFTAASGNTPNQTLGSVTLAAQAFARRPWVGGACQVNPVVDTTNGITHIDLIARLNDQTTGVIVGFAQGLDTNQPFIANLWPTAAAVGGSAIIAAGSSAIIYLIAQQTNPTLSNWSTTMTHASFVSLGLAIV